MARKFVSVNVYEKSRVNNTAFIVSKAQYVDSTSAVVGACTAIKNLLPNQSIEIKAGKINQWEINYNNDISAMISLITDLQFYAQLHLKR